MVRMVPLSVYTEAMAMNEQEEAEVARAVRRLLLEDAVVRSTIIGIVMASPNVITRI